jgi:hypothetical protein
MSAIDQLRSEVEFLQEQRRQVEERVVQEKVAALRQHWENEVGAALLDELQAEFTVECVKLTYRGKTWQFDDGSRRWQYYAKGEVVLDWIDSVDAWYVDRGEWKVRVLEALADCTVISDWISSRIRDWDLGEDAEVAAAFVAAEERIAKAKADRERQAKAEQEARIREVIAELETVTEFPLPEHLYDHVPYSISSVPEIKEAYAQARERAAAAEAEREAQRVILQANVFEPFAYYRVYYARAEEDGERCVDWQTLDSLTDTCDDDGWWRSVGAYEPPVRLAYVFKVERIEVREPDQMPNWCRGHRTEFGPVRLVPEGAERL